MLQLTRLIKIVGAIARYRLDDLVEIDRLPFPARVLMRLLPWRYFIKNTEPRAIRLRKGLESLGPIFIKFGQILSTRRDLLPDDISDELARLQDRVEPFPAADAVTIIEKSLHAPVSELFDRFDHEPMASASIAQVHGARLHSGEEVVVKVIRPGIEKVIRKDIRLMYGFSRLLITLIREAKRLRPMEVVRDYEKTILDELDLLREAANTSQLRRNFISSPLLFVPQVYWDFCKPSVMVMERIYGVPVADTETLKANGTDMKKLAERGVEIFFTQVFRDRFFHADMHPGNIFVDITDPSEPRYIGIDCGIVGTLEPEDQYYLACNLLAFFKRDYRKVAQLHVDSGWVPSHTVVGELEAAIRTVCEPIFERPLKDISFGHLLVRLFQVARRFEMEVQPQLVLLEKTLLNVEGLGRQLYPDLDLWNTAQPYLEKWMKDQVSPCGISRSVRDNVPDWLLSAPNMARNALHSVKQISEHQQKLMAMHNRADKQSGKLKWLGGVLVLLAAAVLVFPEWSTQIPWQGVIMGGVGGWLLTR
ncbi:ubiquinone biosynthesis regulatory protein kinase UbiB [Endozoicomonas numazuensis]|uniref:Probable protein kinase UbiB n=1 Tax=Endozoicomonas numazuensis TaxID=1137799 RepID=A0A081NKH6_9GAMM|nr:ubiquinone biosynthesis regulatory protein kinase UbiB [Endozoicomonas numazuensis]KEQ18949.1 ubiquinone biosynthesis protein UbiB [Endozoicomonas numazuensis]